MQDICSLPSAPSESRKILGFKAALDADDRLFSSYRLPIRDSSSDILKDLDVRISSATLGMLSKKMSKFLPYPRVRSRKYYSFDREESSRSHSLPRSVTELGDLKSYENLKTDVILSSTEAEDLEPAARTVEATSWMDWWTFATRSMTLCGSIDSSIIKKLY